jgi:hypothetical protein
MILRNGRKVIGNLEAIVDSYVVVVAENEKLKRELAQSQWTQAQTQEVVAQRDALWKELKWMQDEMRAVLAEVRAARQQADQKVRELYRERDIARANSANRPDGTLLH